MNFDSKEDIIIDMLFVLFNKHLDVKEAEIQAFKKRYDKFLHYKENE